MTVKEAATLRNDKLGPKLAGAFIKRHFEAWYFSNREDAVAQLFSLIPASHTVSWGGSLTMEALGIQKTAGERFTVIDRDKATSPEERAELMRRALCCDTFISGVNAISEDGQMVHVDGNGNRVAALIYGPKQVIVIAGMNKVVKTLEDAYQRARTIASPLNQQRFPGRTTPCAVNGACGNCTAPGCICTYVVTTRQSFPANRIKVILVNEDLGL
jgi:hypothetical protein